MIKTILVCTDGSLYGDTACEYAINLVKKLDAKLLALHVLDSRMLEGPMMADISGWVGAQPYGAQLQQFRQLMEQKGEAVVNALNDRCTDAGITPETWLKMGHPARVILEEETRAELLIMGRQGEHADFIGGMPGSNVERVVRHSAQPCLITPSQYQPITKILAAYDGSGNSAEALHEAIELAVGLECPLIILSVDEGDEEKARQNAIDGVAMAKSHDLETESLVVAGVAEKVILEQASAHNCDLIIIGAYGHSRIRELILGSTTTYLISHATIPVLISR